MRDNNIRFIMIYIRYALVKSSTITILSKFLFVVDMSNRSVHKSMLMEEALRVKKDRVCFE